MWIVEVKYPDGHTEFLPCPTLTEARMLLRAAGMAEKNGVIARIATDQQSPAAQAKMSPDSDVLEGFGLAKATTDPAPPAGGTVLDMLDPAVVLSAAKIKLRQGAETVEAMSPSSSPRFGATASAAPATEVPKPDGVAFKELLWAAMHRVGLAGAPWSDDFAALVAALSALMRVHHVTISRPLEDLSHVGPIELLRQAREIVTHVAVHADSVSPWPVAMRQCADYAAALFAK